MTFSQIAKKLKLTKDQVAGHVRRARFSLRKDQGLIAALRLRSVLCDNTRMWQSSATLHPMEEAIPPVATGRDQSRHDATPLATDFVLTIEQVADRYAKAGHPAHDPQLQRYCAKGHLDSQKKETMLGGEVYLVSPQSVARHIAQIEELSSGDMVAPSRDTSRPVATTVVAQPSAPDTPPPSTTPDDTQRQVATGSDTSRYVERLEHEIEQAKDERDFLARADRPQGQDYRSADRARPRDELLDPRIAGSHPASRHGSARAAGADDDAVVIHC